MMPFSVSETQLTNNVQHYISTQMLINCTKIWQQPFLHILHHKASSTSSRLMPKSNRNGTWEGESVALEICNLVSVSLIYQWLPSNTCFQYDLYSWGPTSPTHTSLSISGCCPLTILQLSVSLQFSPPLQINKLGGLPLAIISLRETSNVFFLLNGTFSIYPASV